MFRVINRHTLTSIRDSRIGGACIYSIQTAPYDKIFIRPVSTSYQMISLGKWMDIKKPLKLYRFKFSFGVTLGDYIDSATRNDVYRLMISIWRPFHCRTHSINPSFTFPPTDSNLIQSIIHRCKYDHVHGAHHDHPSVLWSNQIFIIHPSDVINYPYLLHLSCDLMIFPDDPDIYPDPKHIQTRFKLPISLRSLQLRLLRHRQLVNDPIRSTKRIDRFIELLELSHATELVKLSICIAERNGGLCGVSPHALNIIALSTPSLISLQIHLTRKPSPSPMYPIIMDSDYIPIFDSRWWPRLNDLSVMMVNDISIQSIVAMCGKRLTSLAISGIDMDIALLPFFINCPRLVSFKIFGTIDPTGLPFDRLPITLRTFGMGTGWLPSQINQLQSLRDVSLAWYEYDEPYYVESIGIRILTVQRLVLTIMSTRNRLITINKNMLNVITMFPNIISLVIYSRNTTYSSLGNPTPGFYVGNWEALYFDSLINVSFIGDGFDIHDRGAESEIDGIMNAASSKWKRSLVLNNTDYLQSYRPTIEARLHCGLVLLNEDEIEQHVEYNHPSSIIN